ncbi:MerR family transcriptional regulator [Streptococcus orisratti]|uniref:MerR family transcriptional regulator n=1 Tax=Streptococcus orisratti TaxID=114652 RepID=UPI0029430B73|nr:MerR family transcriptional regulator [Streptococcus orisratti]
MYSMKEASQLTGLTYDTIKFYCNKGLVPNVERDKNNYRVFDQVTIEWLKSLSCLKNCGMSIAEMQEYLKLCLQGQASLPERQKMLALKKDALLTQLKELEEAIDYIDSKQDYYQKVLDGKLTYHSNLIVKN